MSLIEKTKALLAGRSDQSAASNESLPRGQRWERCADLRERLRVRDSDLSFVAAALGQRLDLELTRGAISRFCLNQLAPRAVWIDVELSIKAFNASLQRCSDDERHAAQAASDQSDKAELLGRAVSALVERASKAERAMDARQAARVATLDAERQQAAAARQALDEAIAVGDDAELEKAESELRRILSLHGASQAQHAAVDDTNSALRRHIDSFRAEIAEREDELRAAQAAQRQYLEDVVKARWDRAVNELLPELVETWEAGGSRYLSELRLPFHDRRRIFAAPLILDEIALTTTYIERLSVPLLEADLIAADELLAKVRGELSGLRAATAR